MSDGPSFIEEKRDEMAEEKRDRNVDLDDSPVTFGGQQMDDLLSGMVNVAVPTPDELAPEGVQNRQERRNEESENLLEQILGDSGLDLEDINESIENINLEEADDSGLLQTIAQTNMQTFQLLQSVLSTQVSMLNATIDVADAVEPPRAITVSGTNVITNTGEPEPLVPQSNNTEILTRTIFVRASDNNSEKIYIGDDGVAPEEGFMLKPSESWQLPIDLRDDIYYMAGEAGDAVQVLGVV